MRIFDWFKEKQTLIEENMEIRKGKFVVEQKLSEIVSRNEETTNKYIDLLEQKCEGFDLYVKYQNQCLELSNEKRELKKQLAETNEICNSLTDSNYTLTKKVEKLERKIKRLENKHEEE